MEKEQFYLDKAKRIEMYNKTVEILGCNLGWDGSYIYCNSVKVLLQNYLIALKSGRLKKYMSARTKEDKKAKKYYVFLKTYLDLILA